MESLFTPDLFLVVYFFVLGTIFGSFGNVLIFRLPEGEMPNGRSRCPSCKHTLRVWDLVPIVSYVCLRGKCRYCKKRISSQYPIIECISALLFAYAAMQTGLEIYQSLLLGLCMWILLLIAVIDAKVQGIPDLLNFPLVVLALAYSLSTGTFSMVSVLIGVGFLGLQWLLSGGKWVGSGDIILIAGMAMLVGPWTHMIFCIFSAYIIGAGIASVLLLTKMKSRKDSLPFAPFLVLSTYITIAWGAEILWHVYGV